MPFGESKRIFTISFSSVGLVFLLKMIFVQTNWQRTNPDCFVSLPSEIVVASRCEKVAHNYFFKNADCKVQTNLLQL